MGGKQKRKVITFNHIDKSLSPEQLSKLDALYRYYHKLFWCNKKTFKHFKRRQLGLNILSSVCITVGGNAGAISLNPVILSAVAGPGLLIKTFSDFKCYTRRAELSRLTFTTYQKVIVDLRSSMRGGGYDNESFLTQIKPIHDFVIDFSPGYLE